MSRTDLQCLQSSSPLLVSTPSGGARPAGLSLGGWESEAEDARKLRSLRIGSNNYRAPPSRWRCPWGLLRCWRESSHFYIRYCPLVARAGHQGNSLEQQVTQGQFALNI